MFCCSPLGCPSLCPPPAGRAVLGSICQVGTEVSTEAHRVSYRACRIGLSTVASLNIELHPLTSEMLEEGTGNEMQTTCHAVWKPNTRNAGTASICSFPDPLLVSCPALPRSMQSMSVPLLVLGSLERLWEDFGRCYRQSTTQFWGRLSSKQRDDMEISTTRAVALGCGTGVFQ